MAIPEKVHLTAALCFELDHCDDAVAYNKLVTRLCDIDIDLATAVAEKVGAPTPTGAGWANHAAKPGAFSSSTLTS
jgi:catalase